MRKFELSILTCQACGAITSPARWKSPCPVCLHSVFTVEIERVASGIDENNILPSLLGSSGGVVGAFMEEAADDGSLEIYYRTHSFLKCGGVEGVEISAFIRAPLEERKKLYIGWKRREVETTLDADHRICTRCKVTYKVYVNEWNDFGFCSRACRAAATKSR